MDELVNEFVVNSVSLLQQTATQATEEQTCCFCFIQKLGHICRRILLHLSHNLQNAISRHVARCDREGVLSGSLKRLNKSLELCFQGVFIHVVN